MHIDMAQIGPPLQLGNLLSGVSMAGSVKTITLYPVFFVPVVGHGIELAPLRHIPVEGRLKTTHSSGAGSHPLKLPDRRHIGRVMRRCQRIKILHPSDRIFIEFHHPRNTPRMHRFEPHCIQIIHRHQHSAFDQPDQRLINSSGVVGQFDGLRPLFSLPDLELVHRPRSANPIHTPLGEHGLIGHREHFVLERSTPQI